LLAIVLCRLSRKLSVYFADFDGDAVELPVDSLLSLRDSLDFEEAVEVPASLDLAELFSDACVAPAELAGGELLGGGGGGGLLLTAETGSELLLLPESFESLLMVTPPKKHENGIESPIIHVITMPA
jgi:hypothetical protein